MTQRRRPLSPEAAAVVRAQLSTGRRSISRRSLLGGAGAVGLGALLSACGTSGSTSSAPSPTVVDKSATDKIVNWANWPLYLDFDDKKKDYPSLEQFQKATGIKATYAEDIEDNAEYYAKIQAQLKNGQDIGKDVVVLTDWMAGRMIKQGYTQKLDHTAIPNWKNLLPNLKNVPFDPGRNHSLTWQSGFTGIAWNTKAVPGGLKSISDLWKPELKGKVEVLSEMRDTMGLIMLDQGVDPSATGPKAFTSADFDKALAVLKDQLNKGQIRQVKGNGYADDLKSGDAIAVIGWSGDIVALDPVKFKFAIPTNGGMLWSDNMMIPIASPHKANAEKLMNWYYDPKIAAEVAEYVNYVCPVEGAVDHLSDPSYKSNKLIFPDAAYLSNVKVFRDLTPAEDTDFTSKFEAALGH